MPVKSPIPTNWDIPAEIRGRLGERAGKQRAMLAAGHLLLIVHVPPKADENERLGRFFWRRPDGTWQASESSSGANTVAKHLEEIAKRLEAIDRSVDEASLAREYFAVMSQLSPLLRSVRNLHKTLQEARELIPADQDLITWRDRAYDLERLAELLNEDAKNGLDFAVARRAEEQAAASHRMEVASHRLNILAAFFFPLATISAVLGTNLAHGLEDYNPPWTFLTVVGLSISLGFVLMIFISSNMPSIEPKKKPVAGYDKKL